MFMDDMHVYKTFLLEFLTFSLYACILPPYWKQNSEIDRAVAIVSIRLNLIIKSEHEKYELMRRAIKDS